jgi:DNA-binding response OmpR family regulator
MPTDGASETEASMAVLVVDDDATVVNLVTAVLHRAGIDAEVALDGPGALQRLGRGRYRAVLSDLTMPGMSGLQLLREARTRGHELPFLIMTAYLPPESELALRTEPGVAGVLRKPFDIKRLVAEVRSLLQSAGADVPDVADDTDAAAEDADVAVVADRAVVADVAALRDRVEVGDTPEITEVRSTVSVVDEVVTRGAERVAELVAEGAAGAIVEDVPLPPAEAEVHARPPIATATVAGEPPLVGALLPLSLLEFVTARLRRQALIAQAERRAAALSARPRPIGRATVVPRESEPLREAEQGC